MAIVSMRRLADVLIGLLLSFSVCLRVCGLESELDDVIQQTGRLNQWFELPLARRSRQISWYLQAQGASFSCHCHSLELGDVQLVFFSSALLALQILHTFLKDYSEI